MIVLGADPGIGGALSFLNTSDNTLVVFDMPTFSYTKGKTKKSIVDVVGLADLVNQFSPDHAFAEEVHASPQMGTVSAFSFGRSYGALLGVLGALKIPLTEVSPQAWKKATGTNSDKEFTRARASQLLPACASMWKRKCDVDRSEATLIAYYGAKTLGADLTTPIVLLRDE